MRPFAQFHSVIPTEELRVMPPPPSMLDATEDSRDREERLHTVRVHVHVHVMFMFMFMCMCMSGDSRSYSYS